MKISNNSLALLGGDPVRPNAYPNWPEFDQREEEAVLRSLRSGIWGGCPYPGPETEKLCRRWAQFQGGRYAVAMMNGTVTLEVAMRAAHIGWGDEVIVPSYSFAATATAPIAVGAVPVLVDVDPDTFCIDPQAIENAITKRTRAIIPVHLGARMADMDAIMAIAQKHALIVIEDCAHAHGMHWKNQGAGTIGDFGSFSMQSSKSITCGEGGILLVKNRQHAYRAESLIDCGRPHDPDGELFTYGSNFRMTELQAALLSSVIEKAPEQIRQRVAMLEYFESLATDIAGIQLIGFDPRQTGRSFYRYIFKVLPSIAGVSNTLFCKLLNAEGIPCFPGYPAMHRYPLFQPQRSKFPAAVEHKNALDFSRQCFPATEAATDKQAVWLEEKVFRDGERGIDDLITAIKKIIRLLPTSDVQEKLLSLSATRPV